MPNMYFIGFISKAGIFKKPFITLYEKINFFMNCLLHFKTIVMVFFDNVTIVKYIK